jgi:cellulose synthase/poly-beta-1,6-N-acetylglucosamine synthase-like glycosyltransferase
MISVIVPAYNAEQTLGACLRALANQSIPRDQYQIIVVDDGSTDKTAMIAEAAGACVIRQPNQGPAAARNHGVQAAGGDLVLFTDSDCEPAPDWIEQMAAPFANPDTIGAKGVYLTRQKKLVARFVQAEYEDKYIRLRRYQAIDFVDTYSAAYRKEIFWKAGGFDTAFPRASGEDIDLSYRLSKMGYQMVFAPQAAVYHDHPDSLSAYFRRKFYVGYWRVRMYQKNLQKAVSDSHTPQVLKLQMGLLCITVAACLGMILRPACGWIALGALAAFWLTTVKFSLRCKAQDAQVAALAFPLLLLRALALTLGMGMGLLAYLTRRRA